MGFGWARIRYFVMRGWLLLGLVSPADSGGRKGGKRDRGGLILWFCDFFLLFVYFYVWSSVMG